MEAEYVIFEGKTYMQTSKNVFLLIKPEKKVTAADWRKFAKSALELGKKCNEKK